MQLLREIFLFCFYWIGSVKVCDTWVAMFLYGNTLKCQCALGYRPLSEVLMTIVAYRER